MKAIYADGGVILRNPSHIGGTWAWCAVNDQNERVVTRSGVIAVADAQEWGVTAVTNNLTELYALYMAIDSLPDGWTGTVYSDSKVSLGRLFGEFKWEGIPAWLRHVSQEKVAKLGAITPVLLDGHPNVKQLASGIGKRGNPCSEHNVWCDTACKLIGNSYVKGLADG